ncbi:MAG: hypothetical protein ACI3YE_04085, partial [Candidatus Avispirillum sp.]
LCTREAKVSRRICGCGANLQMPEVSVASNPPQAAAFSLKHATGFAGGFDFFRDIAGYITAVWYC